jgi:hypothetical protein
MRKRAVDGAETCRRYARGMRCCGAVPAQPAGIPALVRENSAVRTSAAETQVEALLFASALEPLAKASGFYGEILAGELGLGIARSLRRPTP